MASFLDAAGLSGGGSPQLALVVTPLMGMIKGRSGADFVVAVRRLRIRRDPAPTTERVAAADCQRMVWASEAAG